MRYTLFAVLFGLAAVAGAQTKPFAQHIQKVTGDLNKDQRADYVLVTQDTLQDTAPYRLQVFFAQADGSHKQVVSTDKAIRPEFPNGRAKHTWGDGFAQLSIHSGILWIEMGLIRGHYEHKFRFQNGHFELIGYTYVNSDGLGTIYSTDFNLSTGVHIHKKEPYGLSGEKASTETKKMLLRPLPALETFDADADVHY